MGGREERKNRNRGRRRTAGASCSRQTSLDRPAMTVQPGKIWNQRGAFMEKKKKKKEWVGVVHRHDADTVTGI